MSRMHINSMSVSLNGTEVNCTEVDTNNDIEMASTTLINIEAVSIKH